MIERRMSCSRSMVAPERKRGKSAIAVTSLKRMIASKNDCGKSWRRNFLRMSVWKTLFWLNCGTRVALE